MNSAYNINLYIKGTFSGSLEYPLYIQVRLYKDPLGLSVDTTFEKVMNHSSLLTKTCNDSMDQGFGRFLKYQ
jgi:hypothetical protein